MTLAIVKQAALAAATWLTLAMAAPAAAAQHLPPHAQGWSDYRADSIFDNLSAEHKRKKRYDDWDDDDRYYGRGDRYYGEPVYRDTLDEVIGRIDHAFDALNNLPGKAGHALTTNDWLMSIRSRISIPGGTCEFDLPSYYAWQQLEPARRRADLMQWIATLTPLAEGLSVLLGLLREAGVPQRAVAPAGHYQQSLPQGKQYQLLRVRLHPDEGLVPEISGHRLMVAIRFMRADGDGRLKSVSEDCSFELTLCA